MNQISLSYGSVPDQGTIYQLSYLYNPPESVPSTLILGPFIASEYFTNTMVDISPSGSCFLIISPSESEPPICIDSFYTPQRRNCDKVDSILETTNRPILDQDAPDIGICLPLGLIASTTSQMILLDIDLLKIILRHNILVNNNNYSLIYQLYLGLKDIDLGMV